MLLDPTIPTERERQEIARALFHLRHILPGAIWIDDNARHVVMDVGTATRPERRFVSWAHARRIANGEPWQAVIGELKAARGLRRAS